MESSTNWINSLTGSDEPTIDSATKEILLGKPKQKKIVSDFSYQYDDVIGLGMTRYEFGIWLIFAIFYFLRRYLETCGNKKTVFDFMRPSKNQLSSGGSDKVYVKGKDNTYLELTQDDLRKLREKLYTNKKQEEANNKKEK
jgi:hypothetical protein